MNLPSRHDDIPGCFSAEVIVAAPASVVWDRLVSLHCMREWLGGSDFSIEVETTWEEESAIVIRGVHHQRFENRGTVLAFRPWEMLSFTHLSSLSGLADLPCNYTTLSFALEDAGSQTILRFVAAGFPTESIYKHLQFYWLGTLDVFKQYVEDA
ncbi:SRPBCC domain-containing protein [Dyella sp.]|uniref:SRPBCC family protein n=1 Tax=Dyella sp. TaxID=1869338 RepID=UPI002D7A2626|nr:SRPBCC domain-containing protein [Dyella sp.]HET7330852.1 SRPBCC domain-containing protein [Dyella sp.]